MNGKQGGHKQVYFGSEPGHVSYAEDGRCLEAQYSFSAYVSWPTLEDDADVVGLGMLAPDPVSTLILEAEALITGHFRERRRQRRRHQIETWKLQGVYPYRGQPANEAERIERTLFDVVSGTISGQVAQERLEAQLTLSLLKNVISYRPGELVTIIKEITSLGNEDLRALTDLLSIPCFQILLRLRA